jgi:hypothetical protein
VQARTLGKHEPGTPYVLGRCSPVCTRESPTRPLLSSANPSCAVWHCNLASQPPCLRTASPTNRLEGCRGSQTEGDAESVYHLRALLSSRSRETNTAALRRGRRGIAAALEGSGEKGIWWVQMNRVWPVGFRGSWGIGCGAVSGLGARCG